VDKHQLLVVPRQQLTSGEILRGATAGNAEEDALDACAVRIFALLSLGKQVHALFSGVPSKGECTCDQLPNICRIKHEMLWQFAV